MPHTLYKNTALAIALLAATAVPATAGTLNYQGGSARWESTNCQQPSQPNFVSGPANTLSSNVNAYDDYTRAVQGYLTCINQEAQQDMNNTQQQVTNQLNQVNQAWQADLQKNAQILNSKRHP